LFSCSEKDLLPEDVNIAPVQEEISANTGDETFVSSEQALGIAGKFLSSESGLETRALENVSVEAVKDEENGGNPAMYVVNYPEGGWAIVSATRNYFPVLAHSDKGSFNLENISESGVSVWMAETKEAIRLSKDLADSVKVQINAQWLAYEEAPKRTHSATQTRGYYEMIERMDELAVQYSYVNGQWQYPMSLTDAQYYLDLSTYQSLVSMANSLNSPPEYTIVVIRSNIAPTNITIGNLVDTEWHQKSPFNDFFDDDNLNGDKYNAGCAAIAVASVMKYHRHPDIVSNNGYTVDWYDLPDEPIADIINYTYETTNSVKTLIKYAADKVNMKYGIINQFGRFSWATPRAVKNGLINMGYTVNLTTHNISTLTSQLLNENPVIMVGNEQNWPLPSPLDLLNAGHYWVCSGIDYSSNTLEYFVEFWNGSSYGNYGYYTPSNPGVSTTTYSEFYMNWGQRNGQDDAWYWDPYFPQGYEYARQNFYISK
ncbi:MAG: C10 family peptidase, partial [Bacteroidales bacterium]|jgi:hypothetical protein|nr:C10 family peptidase [Bacteroidales bacterium]